MTDPKETEQEKKDREELEKQLDEEGGTQWGWV